MTDSSDTPSIEEWVDDWFAQYMPSIPDYDTPAKPMMKYLLDQRKQDLLAKFQEVDEAARIDEVGRMYDKVPPECAMSDIIGDRLEELTNKSNRTTL